LKSIAQINTSNWVPGIYFAKLWSKSGAEYTEKIILSR
jgi:hypothetical protein